MFHLLVKTFASRQQFQILSPSILLHSKRIRFESTNHAEIQIADTCRSEVEQWHLRNQSCPHPDTFTPEDWKHLSTIHSKTQRRKYCRWLHLKAERKKLQLEQKVQKQNEFRIRHEKQLAKREKNEHIEYGLGFNSLFIRYNQKQFNRWSNVR